MRVIAESDWLVNQLSDPNLVIVDCRFSLKDPTSGRKAYEHSHIPGAVYFDLEKDLSGEIETHGGRHPLPNLLEFKSKIEKAGISNDTTVIAYDGGEGAFAARFWWMLTYLGHQNTYVLNGGFTGWEKKGFPVQSEQVEKSLASFEIQMQPKMLASYEDVKKVVDGKGSETILIDSREEKRYLGIEEPIDKKAGHIPGAMNKVWTEGLSNGYFKPVKEQEERFSEFSKDQPLIVYCGSGVTAIPNYMALKQAGFTNVKVYIGSFSDWISWDDNSVSQKI